MAARVIHLGDDKHDRIKSLKRAGYDVDACHSLAQFRLALQADTDADAVMTSADDGRVPHDAISLVRSESLAPLVLFADPDQAFDKEAFDLVVPSFTTAEDWLLDLAILIVRSRAIRAHSQLLIEQSKELRRESAAARARSRAERKRSRGNWTRTSPRSRSTGSRPNREGSKPQSGRAKTSDPRFD